MTDKLPTLAEQIMALKFEPATNDAGRAINAAYDAAAALADAAPSYQARVKPWLDACFGPEIAGNKTERNHRFLEEALELVQSGGCTISEAYQLVEYVYSRPVGEMGQEVGGVMNTLAAFCLAYGRDMHKDGETELARVWTMVEKIRAKQAAKPKHSPLPGYAATTAPAEQAGDVRVKLSGIWSSSENANHAALEPDPTPALGWKAMQTAAATRVQAQFLPCRTGGDLICDPVQGEASADAILAMTGPTDDQMFAAALELPNVKTIVSALRLYVAMTRHMSATAQAALALIPTDREPEVES